MSIKSLFKQDLRGGSTVPENLMESLMRRLQDITSEEGSHIMY
jgi:hypothetical protein